MFPTKSISKFVENQAYAPIATNVFGAKTEEVGFHYFDSVLGGEGSTSGLPSLAC